MEIKPLFKRSNESSAEYVKRVKSRYYHRLRKILPSLKEQHRLESLVGPKNCWDQLIAYQIALLKDIGLESHHTLLDIGCGPLAGGIGFIEYLDAGNYVGIDTRDEPLHEAYRLISKHELANKNPMLLHSDTFGKNEMHGRSFDFIWVSQLMYHFDDALTAKLFEQVIALLNPSGRFIFDIIAESEWSNISENSQWRGFSFFLNNSDYYLDLAETYKMQGSVHGTLEKYGYPEREGLKYNKVVVLQKSDTFS